MKEELCCNVTVAERVGVLTFNLVVGCLKAIGSVRMAVIMSKNNSSIRLKSESILQSGIESKEQKLPLDFF